MAFLFIGVLLGLGVVACVFAARAWSGRPTRRPGQNSRPDHDSAYNPPDPGHMVWAGLDNSSPGGSSVDPDPVRSPHHHHGHHACSHHDHGGGHHDAGCSHHDSAGSSCCDGGGGGGGSD